VTSPPPDEGSRPTFRESIHVAADPERIWQALTVPDEVVQWDTGVVEPLDAPPDYPRPGQQVRWRYRLGPFPMVLQDRPVEVVACQTFRSSIGLGPFQFAETYTIAPEGGGRSVLTAELSVRSPVPLVGVLLTYLVGYPLARATVRSSLRAIQRHCQTT
jgi:uncharacterized protein YndB with AHSA1/START domain